MQTNGVVLVLASIALCQSVALGATCPDDPDADLCDGDSDAEWTLLMEMAGEQRTLSQQMVKEFFYIAQGMNAEAHKVTLKEAMDEFEVHEQALIYGNDKAPFHGGFVKIVAPPTSTILPGLNAVKAEWDMLKVYLGEALLPQTPSLSTINHVVEEGAKLLALCEESLLLYKDAAAGAGMTVDTLRVETAKKQSIFSQKMTIEALEVFMGYNLPGSAEAMIATMASFEEAHRGLLRGVSFLGLAPTVNMCTLWQMRKVTDIWDRFRLDGQRVVEKTGDEQKVAMDDIASLSVPLLLEMNLAVELYHYPKTESECPHPMTNNEWVFLLNEGNRAMMLGQQVSRLFLQVARGVNTLTSMAALRSTMVSGGESLRELIEGSILHNIPAPPTQAICDHLAQGWEYWKEFEILVEESINSNWVEPFSQPQKRALHQISLLGDQMSEESQWSVHAATLEAIKKAPAVPAHLIEMAAGQRMLLEKMCKEALFVALNEDIIVNDARLSASIALFTLNHNHLLRGEYSDEIEKVETKGNCPDDPDVDLCDDDSSNSTSNSTSSSSSSSNTSNATANATDCVPYNGNSSNSSSNSSANSSVVYCIDPDAEKLDRTENACILKQMKVVWDDFKLLEHDLHLIQAGDRTAVWMAANMHVFQLIDSEIAHTIEDMNKAVHWYESETPITSCPISENPYFKVTNYEWEQVIKETAIAHALQQRLLKEYFLYIQEFYVDMEKAQQEHLVDAFARFKKSIEMLKFGNQAGHTPAAVNQQLADEIFAAYDTYKLVYKHLLEFDYSQGRRLSDHVIRRLSTAAQHAEIAKAIYLEDTETSHQMDVVSEHYVTAAWDANRTVQGSRSKLGAEQLVLIERMGKNAAKLHFGPNATYSKVLKQDLTAFGTALDTLLSGTTEQGCKQCIKETDESLERFMLKSLGKVKELWPDYKAVMEPMTAPGITVSSAQLQEMRGKEHALELATEGLANMYASTTQTTTRVNIDILVPLPFNTSWEAGYTLRTSVLVAEAVINDQQLLLPGFRIQSKFRDDKCDGAQAIRIILEETANSDQWVGIGGLGCDDVCAQVSVVASSSRMPLISYGCPADYLSDKEAYPNFVRMGTSASYAVTLTAQFAKKFGWEHITVVSGAVNVYKRDADAALAFFRKHEVSAKWLNTLESTFAGTLSIIDDFIANKHRVVYFLGGEDLFRQVLCASVEKNMKKGMTWISTAVERTAWWTIEDAALKAAHPTCTVAEITSHIQGALFIRGLGAPLPSQANSTSLSCFNGYTPWSFSELVKQRFKEGVSKNEVGLGDAEPVEHPMEGLMNQGADGTCAFAMALRYMLFDKGYKIDQVRRLSEGHFNEMQNYIRNTMSANGSAGPLKFDENQKPAILGVFQVSSDHAVLVGTVSPDNMTAANRDDILVDLLDHTNDGLVNTTWTEADPDPLPPQRFRPWLLIKVLSRIIPIGGPMLLAYMNSLPGFSAWVKRTTSGVSSTKDVAGAESA